MVKLSKLKYFWEKEEIDTFVHSPLTDVEKNLQSLAK
jgi:hypothetical protein